MKHNTVTVLNMHLLSKNELMLFYIFGLAIKWHIMTIIETTCACMITFNVHCLTVFILLFRSLKGGSMVWIPWWLYSNCSKMQDMYEYYYTRDMLWYFEIAIIICFILNFFKFLNKNQLILCWKCIYGTKVMLHYQIWEVNGI